MSFSFWGGAPPSASPSASTPGRLPCWNRGTGHRPVVATPPVSFRSCGFPPLQRLALRYGLRVCCTPLPTLGFVAFPVGTSHSLRRGENPTFPGDAVRTLRRVVPRRQPHRVTTAAASLPLPNLQPLSRSPARPDFEALLHRRVRCARPPLPVAVARASPGLRSPSRYLPSTSFRFPFLPPHRPRTGEDGRPDNSPVARLSRLGPKPETFPATGRGSREPGSGTCHLPAVALPGQEDGSAPNDPWPKEVPHPGKKKEPIRPLEHHRSPGGRRKVACRARTRNCLLR